MHSALKHPALHNALKLFVLHSALKHPVLHSAQKIPVLRSALKQMEMSDSQHCVEIVS